MSPLQVTVPLDVPLTVILFKLLLSADNIAIVLPLGLTTAILLTYPAYFNWIVEPSGTTIYWPSYDQS